MFHINLIKKFMKLGNEKLLKDVNVAAHREVLISMV